MYKVVKKLAIVNEIAKNKSLRSLVLENLKQYYKLNILGCGPRNDIYTYSSKVKKFK